VKVILRQSGFSRNSRPIAAADGVLDQAYGGRPAASAHSASATAHSGERGGQDHSQPAANAGATFSNRQHQRKFQG
jgi:hypothetical protein